MVLEDIRSVLQQRPDLMKYVKYRVQVSGQNERNRYQKLLDFSGPDSATVSLLQQHGDWWFHNPGQFWQHPSAPDFTHLSGEAQIVGYFLHTASDEA